MENRNKKGQFIKGISYSPKTQFKKGEHWRDKKPYWNRDWLFDEYVNKFRSAKDIADQFGITESAIIFWMRKHDITRRDVSEIRSRKHWGSPGYNNPMFGMTGKLNHNWKGGITPERQGFYSSLEWKDCIKYVWNRDGSSCARCGDKVGRGVKSFAIHHIVSFKYEDLRTQHNNLVLLCKDCHSFIHSTKNINNEFLLTYEQYREKYGVGGNDQ